jgi:hypothetical protein
MSASSVVSDVLATLNAHDADAGSRFIAPNAELLDVPSGETFIGPAGLCQWWQECHTAYPDAHLDVLGLWEMNTGLTVVELVERGTHQGPLVGPAGQEIAATGRPVAIRMCLLAMVGGDRITSARLYYDWVGIMAQLGLAEG